MVRVLFRARDNGQEFPVYFTNESEIAEAGEKLASDEISRRPATEIDLLLEQVSTIGNWHTNKMRV